ncbi:TlpA family protein disulfide reductase [Pedobacter sp. ISL-68]|uniref:TlpA family protein disulfide reductase n=1 Tax=unclassified Pedobacter TaxID=2628915 RepID=UPI001BE56671|nr:MULTISPECIES: TlpA disulfide reductase family protein [unclassified Pedobacter]MBT2559788.1 TlpA family protein disulfide reductase [Pedobacter sp. ISL-64]MBT2592093.1 TlpA family protein disulfide reductase [Pedobacter sp. ISL-68]
MITFIPRMLALICLILFLFFSGDACAQFLVKSSEKIKSLKNISYTDIVETKFSFQEDFYADTLRSYISFQDRFADGRFFLKGRDISYSFDGNRLVMLNFKDSTYNVEKDKVLNQDTRTLAYWATKMQKLSAKMRVDRREYQDTIINGMQFANIRIVESDTIDNSEHFYNISNYIIDKTTKFPIKIISRFKGRGDDGTVFGLIEIHNYSKFVINKKKFPDLSNTSIPSHFKLPVSRQPVVFLANGTIAPTLHARDLTGLELDAKKQKGKILLINFSLIGCPHCVGAAQMLNRINEKYLGKDLVILNIYPIDTPEAILKFDLKENVKTSSYTSDRSIQKAFPFDGYPSFYLIDKQGRIAQSYDGFYKELEDQITKMIESLL